MLNLNLLYQHINAEGAYFSEARVLSISVLSYQTSFHLWSLTFLFWTLHKLILLNDQTLSLSL